jgi:hypothetical protein
VDILEILTRKLLLLHLNWANKFRFKICWKTLFSSQPGMRVMAVHGKGMQKMREEGGEICSGKARF